MIQEIITVKIYISQGILSGCELLALLFHININKMLRDWKKVKEGGIRVKGNTIISTI